MNGEIAARQCCLDAPWARNMCPRHYQRWWRTEGRRLNLQSARRPYLPGQLPPGRKPNRRDAYTDQISSALAGISSSEQSAYVDRLLAGPMPDEALYRIARAVGSETWRKVLGVAA